MKLEELKEDWLVQHQSSPASINYDSLRSKVFLSINQLPPEPARAFRQRQFRFVYELGWGALTVTAVRAAVVSSFSTTVHTGAIIEFYSSVELISLLMW